MMEGEAERGRERVDEEACELVAQYFCTFIIILASATLVYFRMID